MKGLAEKALVWLGIEAGGTRTVALAGGAVSVRKEFGPANLRLLDDARLVRHFREMARVLPRPSTLAIGMAGARTEADRARMRRAAAAAWPGVPCHATNDLETALMAAPDPKSPIANRQSQIARVLVLSGTGSCCFGRAQDGRTAKVGGWGHVLGDKGSAFEIGLRALKAVVYYFDRDGEWSALGRRLLCALELNEPDDLIGWVQRAAKDEIARLAVDVFKAWGRGDAIATDILKGAAASLASDAVACARRLRVGKQTPVQFVFAGSVLLRQPRFAKRVATEIRAHWPRALITPLQRESVEGALALASSLVPGTRATLRARGTHASRITHHDARIPHHAQSNRSLLRPSEEATPVRLSSLAQSPTELRHPRSMHLDRMSLRAAIALMLDEDGKLPRAVLAERAKIERVVRLIVRSFQRGGRLFYVGAGTSGRLGVLDASECPPTFRTDPELVQGIIAGGQTALWSAVEGAEDDPAAGARALEFRAVTRRDTVVGIAASGRTPFVWGALGEARRRGAATVLLCFNPHLVIPRAQSPTVVIAPRIGPEILTGSTRLKSGTATKLILNIFTTLAMVRMGKVLGNLMIDVKASNVKLKDRATRIVCELTGADYATARAALERGQWKIKDACARLNTRRRFN